MIDLFTMGARDLRAGIERGADFYAGLTRYDRETYEAGRRVAFRKACQRLDFADIMPAHCGGAP